MGETNQEKKKKFGNLEQLIPKGKIYDKSLSSSCP